MAGWVNPNVLRGLRLRAGLEPTAVEQESRKLAKFHYAPVSAAEVEAWERGQGVPELVHLETLAEVYGCPVGAFFFEAPRPPEIALSFRGLLPRKQSQLEPLTRRSLARFLELAEWFATTIEERGVSWPVAIKPLNVPSPGEQRTGLSPERIAEQYRRTLGFSNAVRRQWREREDAFNWWRSRLEQEGVFCFQLKLDPRDLRGASLWWKGRYPFILVNHYDMEAASGRLFTLLHEYGHLVLSAEAEGIACDFIGGGSAGNPENFPNRFAAAMLVPPEELESHLKRTGLSRYQERWPDRLLDEIRNPFFVSRDVIAILLEEVGLAPRGFYRHRRERWEQRYGKRLGQGRGMSLKKWQRKARELGSSALRILVELSDAERLPLIDAAYLLDVKVEKLPVILGQFRQRDLSRE